MFVPTLYPRSDHAYRVPKTESARRLIKSSHGTCGHDSRDKRRLPNPSMGRTDHSGSASAPGPCHLKPWECPSGRSTRGCQSLGPCVGNFWAGRFEGLLTRCERRREAVVGARRRLPGTCDRGGMMLPGRLEVRRRQGARLLRNRTVRARGRTLPARGPQTTGSGWPRENSR